MFLTWSLPVLIIIFSIATLAVWIAGLHLSKSTDQIDNYFGLGEAFGGLVFLAIATNLPEIAIVITASLTHQVGIAIGNILGGIAIQTVVLVILDGFGLQHKAALTFKAGSLQLVLEGVLVIIILLITIMGTQLPSSIIFKRLAPGDVLIVLVWLIGLWLISKARLFLPQHKIKQPCVPRQNKKNILSVLLTFSLSAFITLMAGVVLEQSSSSIAIHIGWSGILFGSTLLAAVTALPEVSTGLAAIKMGDYTLAVSDIFGGNAFLPILFLVSTLLSGESVLPQAQSTDIYLASLGALLTAVYLYGLIFRYKKQYFWLGIDSIVVLFLYLIGIIGLFMIIKT